MPAPAYQATVQKAEKISASLTLLTLEAGPGFPFQSGQFLIVHLPPEPGQEKPARGFYSIASPSTRPEFLQLIVEHRPDGGHVSGWMASRQPGDVLSLEGPLGKFGLQPEAAGKNIFLGQGAGIAPLRSMLLHLLESQGQSGHCWLFLGAAGGELVLDAEWKELQKKHSNFHYVPVLMASSDNPWMGKQADPADTFLRHLKDREGLHIYLAGFNKDVDSMLPKLLQAGIAKENIRVEKFG